MLGNAASTATVDTFLRLRGTGEPSSHHPFRFGLVTVTPADPKVWTSTARWAEDTGISALELTGGLAEWPEGSFPGGAKRAGASASCRRGPVLTGHLIAEVSGVHWV